MLGALLLEASNKELLGEEVCESDAQKVSNEDHHERPTITEQACDESIESRRRHEELAEGKGDSCDRTKGDDHEEESCDDELLHTHNAPRDKMSANESARTIIEFRLNVNDHQNT